MPERTTPPFRADQVGSMVRPPHLLAAREECMRDELAIEDLCRIEDEEIRRVVKLQEDIGFKVVTDGEFRRESWNRDFLLKFANVVLGPSRIALAYNTAEGGKAERAPTALAVTGKISRPQPIFVEHFKFLKSIAQVTPKLTIPSPTILHFRGGRESIDAKAYPDMDGFYADVARVYNEEIAELAAAGCTYLQVDDVNFAYICDPRVAAQVRAMGEDPEALPHTYATLINAAIAKRPAGMTVGLHVCRGNAPAGWTEGSYEPVADILFNEIDVTAYFLEYDSPRAGGFEPLRFLPKGKIAVLGLVSTKTTQLEEQGRAQAAHRGRRALRTARSARDLHPMRLFERHEERRLTRHDGSGRDQETEAGRRGGAGGLELKATAVLIVLATLALPGRASADDFDRGRRLFLEKADCTYCHGWAGDGAGSGQSPGGAANLRQSKLGRDQLITVIRCGIPGTAMPHFDEDAYTDKRCYGMTAAELGDKVPHVSAEQHAGGARVRGASPTICSPRSSGAGRSRARNASRSTANVRTRATTIRRNRRSNPWPTPP